jgi:hypothetical protein
MTTGGVNTITDNATSGVNAAVNGVTGTAGKGLDKLPAGVGKPVKHVTDGVGKTATGATDNLYYTAGAATKGVQGTVSKTTGALGKGDVKGTAAGLSSGVGNTVKGTGKVRCHSQHDMFESGDADVIIRAWGTQSVMRWAESVALSEGPLAMSLAESEKVLEMPSAASRVAWARASASSERET